MSIRFWSIAPSHLQERIRTGRHVTVLDVRTRAEYDEGHIRGALSLPLDKLNLDYLYALTGEPDIGSQYTLYLACHSGVRAFRAAEKLQAEGLDNLVLVRGGTEAWYQAGLPMNRTQGVFSQLIENLSGSTSARVSGVASA